MNHHSELRKLVTSLQVTINKRSLSTDIVEQSTEMLSKLGYRYDDNLFPQLDNNINFNSTINSSPNSLAEALLWKMGKWNIYKEFVNSYISNARLNKKTDVVFSAFAKHLKNRENPIYDQHALRAMWAINVNLTSDEVNKCKAALIKSKGKDEGKWKSTLSGRETIDCYNVYVARLKELAKDGLNYEALDKLLMPLGQALKINSKNYEEFSIICGFHSTPTDVTSKLSSMK